MNPLRKYISTLIKEYLSRQDFEDIKQTAYLIHLGQMRRDGRAYISHPLAVHKIIKKYYPENRPAQLLAFVHDALEDADKAGNLSKGAALKMIQSSIHDRDTLAELMEALELLTHDKSIPYVEYLQSVLDNPLSGIVKISDLIHNLSTNPSDRQIRKYATAIEQVIIPRNYLNPDHLNELMKILGGLQ